LNRAFVLVLDSLGVGGAPDARAFGDEGANTLVHIAERCASLDAEQAGRRSGSLWVPHMAALGLGECCRTATGAMLPGVEISGWSRGWAGCAAEISTGKDSQSGHWEIAGMPVHFDWGYFPHSEPCFPADLVARLCESCGLPGILGDRHASGTQIIEELGAAHLHTGRPICYTSADSVFQIAAHEEVFGLQRLYEVCKIARELVNPLRVGRVIARPFLGHPTRGFVRTANRRDYGVKPPEETLLRSAVNGGRDVISVGKIGDLFCHDATGREFKGGDNHKVFNSVVDAMPQLGGGGLLFANFVDFDTLYGHRRDPIGYAAALEEFDARLPEFFARLRPGDLAIITGDHGCDPIRAGSDHTRECIPLLVFGAHVPPASLGRRGTFADIGATVAAHLDLAPQRAGKSFL
jgi:phosphopentomutase